MVLSVLKIFLLDNLEPDIILCLYSSVYIIVPTSNVEEMRQRKNMGQTFSNGLYIINSLSENDMKIGN